VCFLLAASPRTFTSISGTQTLRHPHKTHSSESKRKHHHTILRTTSKKKSYTTKRRRARAMLPPKSQNVFQTSAPRSTERRARTTAQVYLRLGGSIPLFIAIHQIHHSTDEHTSNTRQAEQTFEGANLNAERWASRVLPVFMRSLQRQSLRAPEIGAKQTDGKNTRIEGKKKKHTLISASHTEMCWNSTPAA